MSLLAGVVSRQPEGSLDPTWREELRAAISRHPNEHLSVFEDDRAFLLKADFGAFGSEGFRISRTGSVSMLAGEPLLATEDQGAGANRARDLRRLHEAWDRGNWELMKHVQGVFSAVYYHPHLAALTLISDKLGVRPIYFWADDSRLVFASALRIFEALRGVPKRTDVRAVTEIVSFSFPLDSRTPYKQINAIGPAELLRFTASSVSSEHYWRWDSIPASHRPESELSREVYRRFFTAVARRMHGDEIASAFLSGGLDSRCVVAALCAQTKRVYTLNFSAPQSQDRVFAAEFARQIGAAHYEGQNGFYDPDVRKHIADVWTSCERGWDQLPERPHLLWSGDGGSVGLGHVYMSLKTVALLRQGNLEEGIEQFLGEQWKQVHRKLLKPSIFRAVGGVLHQGMREELSNIHSDDPARDLHIFLLLNDQRRHLAEFHFERIDVDRIELQLPFFDSDFLSAVISVPVDLCVLHRFYNKWLGLFSPAVTSVPWQSYPGHEACPLPVPQEFRSQWDPPSSAAGRLMRQQLLRETALMLADNDFPAALLNRWYIRLARWAVRWGIGHHDHALQTPLVYNRYWKISSGKWAV